MQEGLGNMGPHRLFGELSLAGSIISIIIKSKEMKYLLFCLQNQLLVEVGLEAR